MIIAFDEKKKVRKKERENLSNYSNYGMIKHFYI